MHQDSPLGRLLGSLSSLPVVGRLFRVRPAALKGNALFAIGLALMPFTGLAPMVFGLLYRGASSASHVALPIATEGKRKLPFGLMIMVAIGIGLGGYSLWPSGAAAGAPAAASGSGGLGWLKESVGPYGPQDGSYRLKDGRFVNESEMARAPAPIAVAQRASAQLFGQAPSGAATMMWMVGSALVLLLVGGRYLVVGPERFAADAEGLFHITRADRVGSISRTALSHVDAVLGRFPGRTRGEKLTAAVHDAFSGHVDPLVRGDLQAAAEQAWPPGEYIELHTHLPKHLVRSVIIDGWTITGQKPAVRAPLLIGEAHVVRAYEASIAAAMPAEGPISVAGYFLAACVFFLVANLLASLLAAGWILTILSIMIAAVSAYAAWRWHRVESISRVAAAMLRPVNIAPVLNRIVNSRPDLLTPSKDSVVRYKERLDRIKRAQLQWRKQIEIAALDRFPFVQFGIATGSAQFRGALNGYMSGQVVGQTADDTSRGGIAIISPTGAGKSYAILNPLMAQFMSEQAAFGDEATEAAMAAKDGIVFSAA